MANIDTNSLTSETAASNITSVVVNASGTKKAAPQLVGGRVLIAETVTSGSATNVSFTSIPSTFRHLMIEVNGRGTKAATSAQLRIRLNGDTGTNYDFLEQDHSFNGTAMVAGGTGALAQTSGQIGFIAGSTATANYAGGCTATIYNYKGTTFQKSIRAVGDIRTSSASGAYFNTLCSVWWKSTAAVTQIDVFPDSNALVDGTVVSLYGIY